MSRDLERRVFAPEERPKPSGADGCAVVFLAYFVALPVAVTVAMVFGAGAGMPDAKPGPWNDIKQGFAALGSLSGRHFQEVLCEEDPDLFPAMPTKGSDD